MYQSQIEVIRACSVRWVVFFDIYSSMNNIVAR
jgi:hypothetical protein